MKKWLIVFAVLAFFAVTPHAFADSATPAVETYVDEAVPLPDSAATKVPSGAPLTAGQLTLGDILRKHQAAQAPLVQALPAPSPSVSAAAPLLSATSKKSSVGVMLMQGMQNALQQAPVTPAVPQLTPPQLPTKSLTPPVANVPSSAPASPAPTAAQNTPAVEPASTQATVKYEPGQEPKNLGAFVAPPAAAPTPAAVAAAITPMSSVPVAASASVATPSPTVKQVAKTATTEKVAAAPVMPGCEPHTETWVKTCAEAGYPSSYVGDIKGETNTVCPAGTLKDVWISNTCAAPDVTGPSAAPLSAMGSATTPASATNESALAPAPAVFSTKARADASCGTANGLAANARPMSELCSFGEATDVVGEGPWRWSCKGLNGGMTVSCAAPVAAVQAPVAAFAKGHGTASASAVVEDGLCGSADGVITDRAPMENLCSKGSSSRVSGAGPWTWACSGLNGGQAVSCNAPKREDGACGSADGAGTDEMPMANLCNAGYASAVTGNGPWTWTCSGLNGGGAATCSAAPKKDAVCGSASLSGHHEAPYDNLCSVGQASSVSGNGPWSWTCHGGNGGSSVSCTASVSLNGSCGAANGVATMKAPSHGLCARGHASRVTGVGPWSWNCSGSDDGDTESCTAPMASAERHAAAATVSAPSAAETESAAGLCGAAAELAALEAPEKDLCNNGGTPGSVHGDGPWTWSCSDNAGRSSTCSTLAPMGSLSDAALKEAPVAPVVEEKPVCGAASGHGVAEAPSDELCAVGKSSPVRGSGPWHWLCLKGKDKVSCDAPKSVDAACGPANGSTQKYAPTGGLCNTGTATEVQGTGPWLWSCVGSGGGISVSCSAVSQAQARVDGNCGVASTTPMTSAPDANLCDSGMPSLVYGDGPWTWTCSGLNGGIATSCSTQRNTPPAPPPPGPSVNGLCGPSNGAAMVVQPMDGLCSAGTVTQVSGNGPWNWGCIGENGGMSVSCTAPLQPPAPITGMCGSASGVPTLTTPRSGLCAAGISSAVSGKGPWTWSCSGTNGGGAVGCVAPLAGAGNVGSLPSLVTPSGEAPAPHAAMVMPVSSGLVTPRLPAGPLPPLESGSMPQLVPSSPFPLPPEPSAMPPVPAPGEPPAAPASAPDLPAGTTSVLPPPVRDTLAPAPALRAPSIDTQGALIPGNHFTLDPDVASIPFTRGSDNIDPTSVPTLDKLTGILASNGKVRITLTAYADSNGQSPREARRLSLTRALAIRDYLTTKGVSSGRIDVRALGANVPSGEADRVDVTAN